MKNVRSLTWFLVPALALVVVALSMGQVASGAPKVINNFLTAADGTPQHAVWVDNDGRVGVGTTSPAAKVQVVAPGEGSLALRLTSGPNAFLDVKPTNTGGRFQTVFDTLNTRDIVFLNGTGNIGIGTTSPAAKVQVVAPGEGSLALRLTSGPNAFLDVKPTNTGGRFQTVFDTLNTRDIVFLNGSTKPVLTLTQEGRMGIHGDASQDRNRGGFVKALIQERGNQLVGCYNSQASTPSSTVPCGFSMTLNSDGDITFNLGFAVSDRFISVTPEYAGGIPVIPTYYFPSANQVRVRTWRTNGSLVGSALTLVIY